MNVPLIVRPKQSLPLQQFFQASSSVFALFLIYFIFNEFIFWRNKGEHPVGTISVGSKVGLVSETASHEIGLQGTVHAIEGHDAIVYYLDDGILERTVLPMDSLVEISPTTHLQSSNLDLLIHQIRGTKERASDSPLKVDKTVYWHYIKNDPWFTDTGCNGNKCSGGQKCSEAYYMFHRRLAPLLKNGVESPHKVETFHFGAGRGPDNPEQMREHFLKYTSKLLEDLRMRLILVSVTPEHTFLIEQNFGQFFIYQSWHNSFDLRYWVNLKIPTSEICEPGKRVSDALSNPSMAIQLARLDINDDRESIESARAKYGGFNPVSNTDIHRIFTALTRGFFLNDIRLQNGRDALLPVHALLEDGDTRPFLGKSAIDVAKMFQGSPFEIEISIMQPISTQQETIHFDLEPRETHGTLSGSSTFLQPPHVMTRDDRSFHTASEDDSRPQSPHDRL